MRFMIWHNLEEVTDCSSVLVENALVDEQKRCLGRFKLPEMNADSTLRFLLILDRPDADHADTDRIFNHLDHSSAMKNVWVVPRLRNAWNH